MQLRPILPKSQITEEDIKFHYIKPAITEKWHKDLITMETKITDGKINLKGNLVVCKKPKKADYMLYLAPTSRSLSWKRRTAIKYKARNVRNGSVVPHSWSEQNRPCSGMT